MRSGAVALVFLAAAAACGDPDFVANAEDQRRLDVLMADPVYADLAGPMRCEASLAHYVPAGGGVLDVGAMQHNQVECVPAAASAAGGPAVRDLTAGLIGLAEGAGWQPSMFLSTFEFRRRIGGVWASMSLRTGPGTLTVTRSMPPHTGDGSGPGPSQVAAGRACLDHVRAKAPPTDACSLAR